MAKATKKKQATVTNIGVVPAAIAATGSTEELNEFADPEGAMVQGSTMQLAVMTGNDLEAPSDPGVDSDPAADAARDRLKQVLTSHDDNFYDIARDMSYIANKKAYQQWGFKTFESFLDAEFKMAKRKGQYYVQVFNYFESGLKTVLKDNHGGYSRLMDAIRREGWTKGRVLAREQIVTHDNVDEVISKVETCGYRELETYCKAARESMSDDDREKADDNNDVKTVRVAFQCSLPQKDDIEAAVELATVMIGKETTRSSAMAWAAADFVATNVSAQGKDRAGAIAELLSKYERLFGIAIVAIDEQTKAIAYGQANLERLSL